MCIILLEMERKQKVCTCTVILVLIKASQYLITLGKL
jgi:hypothetical protein